MYLIFIKMTTVAFGYNALAANTSGTHSTAIGYSAYPCEQCCIIFIKYKPIPKDIYKHILLKNNDEIYYQYHKYISRFCYHNKKIKNNFDQPHYDNWVELYLVFKELSKKEFIYNDIFSNIIYL